ncbi:MAG TPA: SH3 domain-containing protein [Candidatus Dormibacteraeota bacterium]|nr:SH3 domain-containing protein [Candidatus Dormibacteraeota bacterium]
MRARGVAPVLVAVLALAACGPSTSSRNGVATNPADLPNGGALISGTPGASGTSGAQTSGVRTVLAPLGLNLRAADSAQSQILGTVAQGTLLTVIGHSDAGGGWYHVKGATTNGWITADPKYSSPHNFSLYQSAARGFSVLYLADWTFSEDPAAVVFRPQSGGGQAIDVATAATLDQLGPAGENGYTLASTDSVEVFGVTANLRVYSRTGTVASPGGPDSPPPLSHLAEIRFTIDPQRAMRLDFGYDDSGLLQQFTDFYDSISFPPPATPGPSGSPGASPTPLPPGATPTPL